MTRFPQQAHSRAKSIAARLVLAAVAFTVPSTLAAADATAPAASASLKVTFQGLKTPSGTVMISLAGSPDEYAGKSPPTDQTAAPVSGTSVSATFVGLKPGTYAIRAFHDLNGDGKLNTNPFGIPTEPYAFSTNARGSMGPPPWSAAAFEVKAGDNGQTIDID